MARTRSQLMKPNWQKQNVQKYEEVIGDVLQVVHDNY
jgi:hypothetical protein